MYLSLIKFIGLIVPRRLHGDWRQEWEAELRCRERLLAEWDRLDWRNKLDLLRRSLGAFRDALLLQPRRLEDEMFQDLRFGVRMLLKHKVLAIVAVLSLALGIGANTAIFSLIDALLLRTLPVAEPQRLAFFTIAGQRSEDSFTYPLYQQFRDRNRSFSGVIAAAGARRMKMTVSESEGGARVESARGQMVSGNFFSVLGVNAALGRAMVEDDDRAGSQQAVAVISYGFWQRRFGGDPAAIGKRVTLDDTAFTIIGVAPPKFFGFEVGGAADLWYPLQMADSRALSNRSGSWVQVMGRLRPEANATQARAEMDVILQHNGPIQINLALNARALGFTLAVSLLTGLLAGLAPALRATRLDLVSSLKEQAGHSSAGSARLPLNKLLVVAQVALSLFLLVGAGLFVRSLQKLKNLDAGFDRENVTLFELDPGPDYTAPRRAAKADPMTALRCE